MALDCSPVVSSSTICKTARSRASPQNARYVPFSVRHSENLKRIASRFINDKVRENPVEKNLLVREISAAVAAVWDVGQLVKTFEQLSDNSVRRVHSRR
jgi:hypothetical protein